MLIQKKIFIADKFISDFTIIFSFYKTIITYQIIMFFVAIAMMVLMVMYG